MSWITLLQSSFCTVVGCMCSANKARPFLIRDAFLVVAERRFADYPFPKRTYLFVLSLTTHDQ